MNSTSLRQFWSMVEQIQSSVLLELSERELSTKLQEQWEQEYYYGETEIRVVQDYIQAKMPLIRDLADVR